ncbi:MAG: hypothetical protein HFG15_01905 [Bacilli bacterium]|jgi:hypothetical protein|nr:hypothetical protein [Bacilli bacterium]
MKKILILISVMFVLVGCDMGEMNNTPTKQVEMFLSKYQTLDSSVLEDLDDVVKEEVAFNSKQRDTYRDYMKKHYQELQYDVKEEKIDGDQATVTVEIEVRDYSKLLRTAKNYLEQHPDKFQNEKGEYDDSKFMDYRLEQMKKAKDRVKYTMELTLTKKDKKWQMNALTEEQHQKLHGIYEY